MYYGASNECASCEKVCLRPINECSLVITCATLELHVMYIMMIKDICSTPTYQYFNH
jgi:hypothetical protein